MISNTMKLSVIIRCDHKILKITALQEELNQQYNDHEVILLTPGKIFHPQKTESPNIRIIQVSHRSDLNGQWQAGIQAATHHHIVLINNYYPNQLNQYSEIIKQLFSSPSSQLVFPQKMNRYLKWFATNHLLNHRYHKLMPNIAICGFNRQYLFLAQQQRWYKKLFHHFLLKPLSPVQPSLGHIDLYH
ncbi:MAG: hypothetical protein CENE_01212 [Candidatus Celerinatantimonas neptuna]|nr:MAG: hypothetical protein CENE_01212 [Candidatus Celerinatantimonas neptuna]